MQYKNMMKAFIVLLVILPSSCNQQKRPSNKSAENGVINKEKAERDIQTVIAAETAAFVERDSTKLLSFYTSDEITRTAWNSPDGAYGAIVGLEKVRANIRQAFKTNPERQNLPDVERTNWYFRHLSDSWVWVNFQQRLKLVNGKIYSGLETRLMKKEGNDWKIAVMYALTDHGLGTGK